MIYVIEYGSSRNLHIHLALNFNSAFSELYSTEESIKDFLYSVWNNLKVKNGSVWLKEFEDEKHKKNYIKYIFKELLPLSCYHFRQKQIDFYHIYSFDANYTKVNSDRVVKPLAVLPVNNRFIDTSKIRLKTVVHKKEYNSFLVRYHYQLTAIVLAIIWFLTV